MSDPHLTAHARQRMAHRCISLDAVRAAIDYGRHSYVRGALIYALGRRDVAAAAAQDGIDLSPYRGVHVVCSPDGQTVFTTYRNHDLRGLRPQRRRRGRRFV